MRIFFLLISVLPMSACASMENALQSLTPEQSAAIEQECGRLPVSAMKGHESPRKILCRSCKPKSLQAIEEANDVS